MKVFYNVGLLVVRTDSKLSKPIETVVILPYSSGWNRFKTFVTHGIHVIAPYSAGLLVVGIDLKVSKHIEFMGKYLNWFEQIRNFRNTLNTL